MRYNSLNSYLKEKFGCKIYKLALSGGLSCPNRDGTISTGGCIFCSNGGSGDFYGELLTEHQKEIYEDFILNDLSLGEIAQDRGISRQGVHDLVKRCDKILNGYEEKLHLVERFTKTKEDVAEICKLADEPDNQCNVNRIKQIAQHILENY